MIDDRKSGKIMIQYLFIGSRSELIQTWFRCNSLRRFTIYLIAIEYFPKFIALSEYEIRPIKMPNKYIF